LDIILARHGETEWNVGEIFRGRADIDLDDTGRKQAELLGKYLSDTQIEAVYSSPLKRALNTGRTIAVSHNLEVQITSGLNDLNFGEWEGLSVSEVRDRYSDQFALWVNQPEKVRLPGGETLDDVTKRARKIVDETVIRYQGTIVLVTHRVVIKILVCALLGLDNSLFWNIMVDTCGLTTFHYEKGRFVLIRHNDNSFLRSMKSPQLKDF
jgi:broad specificity phosphatase PhoE